MQFPTHSRLFARIAAAFALAITLMFSTLAVGFAPARAQSASTGIAAAAITPADAVIYFGFSLDTESAQWTLAEELLRRTGLEEDATSLVGEVSPTGDADSLDELTETEALLGGEVAVVVTDLEALSGETGPFTDMMEDLGLPETSSVGLASNGAASGVAFILQPSDIAAATQQIEAETNADGGVQSEETIYNGITIVTTAADSTTGEGASAYAIVGDFIILSESAADLEPLIDVSAGDTEPLSELEAFQQADEALSGDRLGFGYLNGTTLTESVAALDESGLGLEESYDDLLGTQFFFGLSLIADPAGFRFDTVQIPADGSTVEPAGIAADLTFAGKVPAGSLAFANGFGLGEGAVLQGIGLSVVTAIHSRGQSDFDLASPVPMPDPEQLYEEATGLLGFNLKSDVLDQLVGEYGFALWYSDPADPSSVSAVISSGAESPATLADALSKFSLLIQAGSEGDATVTTRLIGESTVNILTVQQDGDEPLIVEYGVVDGEFLIGFGAGIDDYLAGADDTLADSEDYRAALAALPAEHHGVLYINIAAAAELAGPMMGVSESTLLDDDEACAEYETQAEAQAAYDADPTTNFFLDWDFDAIACDDYFAPATPEAAAVEEPEFVPVRSFATVNYAEEGLGFTSSILVIAEE